MALAGSPRAQELRPSLSWSHTHTPFSRHLFREPHYIQRDTWLPPGMKKGSKQAESTARKKSCLGNADGENECCKHIDVSEAIVTKCPRLAEIN